MDEGCILPKLSAGMLQPVSPMITRPPPPTPRAGLEKSPKQTQVG